MGIRPPRTWYFSGVLEKLDHLAEFLDRFVDARHVVEGHSDVFLGEQLAAAAAEGHGRPRPAHPPDQNDGDDNQRDDQQKRRQVAVPHAGLIFALGCKPFLLQEFCQSVVVRTEPPPRRHELLRLLRFGRFLLGVKHLSNDTALDLLAANLQVGEVRIPNAPFRGAVVLRDLDGSLLIGLRISLLNQPQQIQIANLGRRVPQQADDKEDPYRQGQKIPEIITP